MLPTWITPAESQSVELSSLSRGEAELQERLAVARSHPGYVVSEDRRSARVALLLQQGEDLVGRVPMAVQQAADSGFERIQFGGSWWGFALLVRGAIEPQRNGVRVQPQFQGDLSCVEPVAIAQLEKATEGLVIGKRAVIPVIFTPISSGLSLVKGLAFWR